MSIGSFPYPVARWGADLLWRYLTPLCHMHDVAGSLRRKEGDPALDLHAERVGDIELVLDLAVPVGDLVKRLKVGNIRNLAGRDRKRTCEIQVLAESQTWWLPVELHLARREQFLTGPASNYGWKLLLTTGDAMWNQLMVTPRAKWGLKPDHLQLDDGMIYVDGEPQDAPTEQAVFDLWGLPWVRPSERSEVTARALRKQVAA